MRETRPEGGWEWSESPWTVVDLFSAHALDIPHPLSFASCTVQWLAIWFCSHSDSQMWLSDADLASEIQAQVG